MVGKWLFRVYYVFRENQIFVNKEFKEIFTDRGTYCITRQVREENVNGTRVALTSLGGTARLVSFDAWRLGEIEQRMWE